MNLPPIAKVARFTKYTTHAVLDESMNRVDLHDMPDPDWIPARITRATEVKALNKISMLRPEFDRSTALLAWDMLRSEFSWMPKCRQWTYEEVVAEIDRSKSPGYPWTVSGFTTKGQVLDTYEPYLRAAFDGQHTESFWCIQLKNELRPKEKVEEDKTRIFIISDIKHNIQVMRFFGEFAFQMIKNWRRTRSGVGMSMFYGDWNFVMQQLSKHPNGMAADLGACDASVPFSFLKPYLLEFMPEFLDIPKEGPIREYYEKVIVNEIDKFIVTLQGNLLRVSEMNASGSFLTVWINIFFVMFMYYYVWIKITGKGGTSMYTYFRQNVESRHIGDDQLCTTSDAIRPAFNMFNISEILKTHIDITWSSPVPLPLTELDFCSQNTVLLDGQFFPYPRFNKWTGSIRWDYTSLTVPQKLGKLCAIRLQNYYGPDFKQIDEVTRRYIHAWDPMFHGHKEWEDAKSQYWSSPAIEQLYTGKKYEFLRLHQ